MIWTPRPFQRGMFQELCRLYRLRPSGVIYDVTNTYLYGRNCPMGKLGHDKEGVKGRPLVQIGLAATQKEGFPLFHKVFDGNDARVHGRRKTAVAPQVVRMRSRSLARSAEGTSLPYLKSWQSEPRHRAAVSDRICQSRPTALRAPTHEFAEPALLPILPRSVAVYSFTLRLAPQRREQVHQEINIAGLQLG